MIFVKIPQVLCHILNFHRCIMSIKCSISSSCFRILHYVSVNTTEQAHAEIATKQADIVLFTMEMLRIETINTLKFQTICIEQKIFHAHEHESFLISPWLFRSTHYNNLLK